MSDPLEIMDDIERNYGIRIPQSEWQHFRTAIEAQAERVKWLEAQVEAAKRFDVTLQAEALREFANRKRQEAGRCDGVESMSQRTRLEREAESADKEADRIEHETKEQPND